MKRPIRVAASLALAAILGSVTGAAAQQPGTDVSTGWMVNRTGAVSAVFHSAVNIQSVQAVTRGGQQSVEVQSAGIPSYSTTVTASALAELQQHPASDFRSGHATVSAGQTIEFGQDVGFATTGCQGQPGYGYWPPGPACATAQQHDLSFPVSPQPATTPQATQMGEIGLWLNGVGVFNWADAHSYREQGVWHQTAVAFEGDTMDICGGHSANGDYHHHFYSPCLAQQLGDDGSGHSPIYGYALDAYPIYGPWTAAGQLAQSGWRLRDYDSASSPTGCGGGGQRACLLVDQTDVSKGTQPTSQPGPSTHTIDSIGMGKNKQLVAGSYAEDYYYDRSCDQCLDEHNGRDDGDGLGYHYVLTVSQAADGSLQPVFPYILGLTYAGVLSPGSGRPGPGQGAGPAQGQGAGGGPPGQGQGPGQGPPGLPPGGYHLPGNAPDDPRRR